jgi:hypothetical protein
LVRSAVRPDDPSDAALGKFARAIEGHGFSGLARTEFGGIASAREALTDTGLQVVLRFPSDPALSARLQNFVFRLAHQMAKPDLVLPSATSVHEGRKAMVTRHAGPGFRPATRAKEWLDRVPEETRLAGALIDVLTRQTDRNSSNVMIDPRGRVRLIDHDKILGHQERMFIPRQSMFFRGRPLAYRSKQDAFSDLPAPMRALVEHITARSRAELMGEYALADHEAERLATSAKWVEDYGLTKAIQRATIFFRPP